MVPKPNAHEGGERSKPHEWGVVSLGPYKPATAAAVEGVKKHLPENLYTVQ